MAIRKYLRTYSTRITSRFFRDEMNRDDDTRRDFHIKTGDYFASLATIIGFIEEKIQETDPESMEARLLEGVRKDAIYIQKNYTLKHKK